MSEASAAHRSTTYGVLPNHNAAPVAPLPRVLFWSERVNGWWPGVARACAACGGRLDATPQDTPSPGPGRVICLWCGREPSEVHDRRRPEPKAIADDPPCRTGRPRRSGRPETVSARIRHCRDCGVGYGDPYAERCQDCENARRWRGSLGMRLVGLLAGGQFVAIDDLAALLGVQHGALRKLVQNARAHGHLIEASGRGHYRLLEGKP